MFFVIYVRRLQVPYFVPRQRKYNFFTFINFGQSGYMGPICYIAEFQGFRKQKNSYQKLPKSFNE